jgi:FHS family L-fucose permease-like MFS transporter
MYKKPLISLTVLFFMLGFITCLNDILVPFLKSVFDLSYSQAALVQFCFFGAYGLTSIPASKVIDKYGYKTGMVIGFVVTAIGCLLFYPAVSFNTYGLFLTALFVLASGIVLLQVAGNPFVSILGPKESASSRLTMVQAFNSFGTFIAPFFGAYFILSGLQAGGNSENVKYPYLFIAVVLVLIAIVLAKLSFPPIKSEQDTSKDTWKEVLAEKNLILGMVGIFAYVGAEVAIGSFLVNYITEIMPMPETEAARMVAVYWGGAMVGRFLGIFTLNRFAPGKVLLSHSILSIGLILISISSDGMLAVYGLILVGFFNSIMFPTIFTLGIKGLTKSESKASGLLATAILGGAIIPLLTGQIADSSGLRTAFILPAVCYAYIAWFGFRSRK